MNRVIGALLGAAAVAAAFAVQAQGPDGPHRVGILIPATTPDLEVFRVAMKQLGHTEGVNLTLDVRIAGERLDRLSAMAGEIVKASPDVILAVNTPGTKAAMAATRTIPIVMVAVGDPVGSGFVGSFARPDRNATGVTNLCGELAGKRLELFKEALPKARRIAVMFNSRDPITQPQVRDVERMAPSLGIEARLFPVRADADVDSGFDALRKWRADGILWLCGQQRLLALRSMAHAARHRVPVMVFQSSELPDGGLMSYAAENTALFRRAAAYVDKILKGAKVSDLPVEQPTKFELVFNKKVAEALGLAIPQSILLRADRVIQ
jgi:putative ABC transport system substrate-binding protein